MGAIGEKTTQMSFETHSLCKKSDAVLLSLFGKINNVEIMSFYFVYSSAQ